MFPQLDIFHIITCFPKAFHSSAFSFKKKEIQLRCKRILCDLPEYSWFNQIKILLKGEKTCLLNIYYRVNLCKEKMPFNLSFIAIKLKNKANNMFLSSSFIWRIDLSYDVTKKGKKTYFENIVAKLKLFEHRATI